MTRDAILAEAKKYIPDPSYIMSVFDLMFEWAENAVLTVTGYTLEEFTKKRNIDLLYGFDEQETRNKFLERVNKGEGNSTLQCKIKDGRIVEFEITYKTFMFEDEMHLVAKVLNVSFLNPDGTRSPIDIDSVRRGTDK